MILPLLLLTACSREDDYDVPEGKGALLVSLENPVEGVAAEDVAFYLCHPDGRPLFSLAYGNPRELSAEPIPLDPGDYLLAVVANTGATVKSLALPLDATVPDLAVWLDDHAGHFPHLLTASAPVTITLGEVHRQTLVLQAGTDGLGLTPISLPLTLPGVQLPDYTATRATGNNSLRCIAEVYQVETDNRIHRRIQDCTLQADGTYLAELSLMPGNYDLRLWADWNGGYYKADDLSAVTVLTDSYVANGETDKKDAYYAAEALTVTDDMPEKPVTLTRPFARYRLIANDVEGYLNLIKNGEDLPAIEDLQVRVTYEGFFPTGFDVATGKPNDALNIGINYTTAPVSATGYPETEARQVGADFVLTNGEESFVTVTVQMTNKHTGEAISTVSGIKIPYKRGHITTVTGRFLTAGKTTGGVQVDNNWENDVTIDF